MLSKFTALAALCLFSACNVTTADYCRSAGHAAAGAGSLVGALIDLAICSGQQSDEQPIEQTASGGLAVEQLSESVDIAAPVDMAAPVDQSRPDLASHPADMTIPCPSGDDSECPVDEFCWARSCVRGGPCSFDRDCGTYQSGQSWPGVCGAGGFCRPDRHPVDLSPPSCIIDDQFTAPGVELPGLPPATCAAADRLMGPDCKPACAPGASPGRVFTLYARQLPSDGLHWTTIAYGLRFEPAHDVGILMTGLTCAGGQRAYRFIRLQAIEPQPTDKTWIATTDLGGNQGLNCPDNGAFVWGAHQIIYAAVAR